MRGVKSLMLMSAAMLAISATAQQGIFYYVNTNPEFINSKTVDVANSNGNLMILNQCSDAKYEHHAIQIIELNKSLIKTSENVVKVGAMHDVCNLAQLGNGNFSAFVNTSESNFMPVQVSLSAGYKDLGQKKLDDMASCVFVSGVTLGKQIIEVSTFSAAKGQFEIRLSSFDAANGDLQWTKKVSSEQNESVDAMVADHSGNVVVLGRKYNDSGNEYIPILYKVSAKGDIIWKKSGVDMPSNFFSQSITVSTTGDIYYACGLNQRYGLQTKIIKLDERGNTKRTSNINDFTNNGLLWLSSGKILLYGSRFYTDKKQVVTKGAYVIIDADLNELSNKSLGVDDKPDSDFNYSTTSSSDLQAATELESGSIVMIGKVAMPQSGNTTDKQNNTIVVISDAAGNYK